MTSIGSNYVPPEERMQQQMKPKAAPPMMQLHTEWINPSGNTTDQGIVGGIIGYVVICFLLEKYYMPESLLVAFGALSVIPLILSYYVLPYLWIPRTSTFGENLQVVKEFFGGGVTRGGMSVKDLGWRSGQKLVMYKEALEISKNFHRQVIPFSDIKEIKNSRKQVIITVDNGKAYSFAPNGNAEQTKNAISTLYSRYLQENPKSEDNNVFN